MDDDSKAPAGVTMADIDKATGAALLDAAAQVEAGLGDVAMPRVNSLRALAVAILRGTVPSGAQPDGWAERYDRVGHVAFAAFNEAVWQGALDPKVPISAVAYSDRTEGGSGAFVVLGTDPARVASLALRQSDMREAEAIAAAADRPAP